MYSSGLLFISNLFSTDMLVIIFFALLLFGGEKLPEIARGLGKGIRDFKDASDGIKREINNQIYSFEEKQEEKKLEEAAANHHEQQTQLPESTSTSADTRPPVENTIPMSQSPIYTGESTDTDVHPADYVANVNGNHVTPANEEGEHAGNEHVSNETTKNS
jgi:sec-independent protein translocase protein TatA